MKKFLACAINKRGLKKQAEKLDDLRKHGHSILTPPPNATESQQVRFIDQLMEAFKMKKTVVAALTAAVVVGTGATALAATNPFSDVPAGHWAYQSIAKLAAEGVVEGYGDDTYRGDRNITRYEMAQMIAKAMAKNPSGSSKAELDRLAAEFRDELENLGVRVAELEKYADKVIWNGELRYRYWNEKEDVKGGGKLKTTKNRMELRLLPTAEVNDNWVLKARVDARVNMSEDKGDSWDGDFHLRSAYAKGTYDKLTIQVGKFDFFTNVDNGLVMDDFLSGAALIYGSKVKLALLAGRYSSDGSFDDPASYQGGELSYDNDKFYLGAGYHHFNSDDFKAMYGKDDANVWSVGTRYNIGSSVNIHGAYANNTKAKEEKKSWTAGLSYKGADKKKAGSWGMSADYRYTSKYVSLAPTYDTWFNNSHRKGVEFGVDWAPIYNTYVKVGYFLGEGIDTKEDIKTFFGRASWFF